MPQAVVAKSDSRAQWWLPPPEECEDPDAADEPCVEPIELPELEPWLPPQVANPPEEPEVRAGAGAAKEALDGMDARDAVGAMFA